MYRGGGRNTFVRRSQLIVLVLTIESTQPREKLDNIAKAVQFALRSH